MPVYVAASVADLATIQVTAIGAAAAFGVVATVSLAVATLRAAEKFRTIPSMRNLPGSRLRNVRKPRSSSR
jgi:hypothetical protein